MDQVVIYGAGIVAGAAINYYKRIYADYAQRIIGCVVSDSTHNSRNLEDIPVYCIYDAVDKCQNAKVVIAVRDRYVKEIINLLGSLQIHNYELFDMQHAIKCLEEKWEESSHNRYEHFKAYIDRETLSDEEYIMFLSKQLKTSVLNFEVNLADHCNLNCQCCNHFSPIAPEHLLDVQAYEKDIMQLVRIAGSRIGRLMLLGGEPLLHPDIIQIMEISRRYMSNTNIVVFSNGLLLKNMSKKFWNSCKKNDIGIVLTKYPIPLDYESLKQMADQEGVQLTFSMDSRVNKTTYRLPIKESGVLNPYKNYAKCYHANECVVLRDGRLYTCPIAAYIDFLNSHFNKKLPEKDRNSISIYEVDSFEQIDDFLKWTIPLCKHCNVYEYEYDIPWKQSNKDIGEWIQEA